MARCVFCDDRAGSELSVPSDFISELDLSGLDPSEIDISVPICTECRDLLKEVRYSSLESAARYIASCYREIYAHLLMEVKWTQPQLQQLGYNLRSTIELAQKAQLEAQARVQHCDRVGQLGAELDDDLMADIQYRIEQARLNQTASEG